MWKHEELKSGIAGAEGDPHSTALLWLWAFFSPGDCTLSLGTGLGGWERGTSRSRRASNSGLERKPTVRWQGCPGKQHLEPLVGVPVQVLPPGQLSQTAGFKGGRVIPSAESSLFP